MRNFGRFSERRHIVHNSKFCHQYLAGVNFDERQLYSLYPKFMKKLIEEQI